MCDDHCGILVHLVDGRVVDIVGNPDHMWNQGRVCAKARGAVDMIYHPDRILKPLKKTPGGFVEIPLEQALDEIATRMREVMERHGVRSTAVWKGEAVGFGQQEGLARRFAAALGTPNYLSNDSMCFVARYCAYKLVDGDWPVPDLEHARCIVMWGANPPHAHPSMMHELNAARHAGATLIVVDPRTSAIARRADIHVRPRPGTDGALAWGLIHLLIETGACAADFVADHTLGFERVAEYAKAFTPAAVEAETGVPAETIRAMTSALSGASPQVTVYLGNGLEHHENGVNNIRAIVSLDGLLGSLDVEGGDRYAEPLRLNDLTLYDERPPRELEPLGADRFPVLYDLRHESHTMTAMGAILDGDPYALRAMIVTGANPALTNPNSSRVRAALEALDLLVVRDLFLTETAERADYVLPAASFLERNELHVHARRQLVTLTRKVVSFPEVQGEYDFWHDLAHRLGIGDYFPWSDEEALDRWLLEPTGLDLDSLVDHPEGVQYAPIGVRRWETGPLPTPPGKVELTSRYLEDLGYDALPVYRSPRYLASPDPAYPFVLITGARKLLYLHSRYRNIERFRSAASGPGVEMHPVDAATLGMGEGDVVRLVSSVGSLEIAVQVVGSEDILPGTVQVTHGWSQANVNLLTHDDRFDPVSGFPLMKSVQVRVERL